MVDMQNIRAHAKDLLEKGQVQCVLGYRRGTAGAMVEPTFVTDPAEVEQLVWDPTCVHNLALYLVNEKKARAHSRAPDTRPIAVVAKGCDSRAINVLLQEKHFSRSEVHVIGVSCEGTGMVDQRKLSGALKGKAASSVAFEGNETVRVSIHGGGEVSLPAREVMADRCLECSVPYPVVHDVTFGEEVQGRELQARFAVLAALEEKSVAERSEYWQNQFARCLRCYACRSVCPMCYCDECVVDSINFIIAPDTTAEDKANRIKWIERSPSPSENSMYHLVRAMHLAGRCIDCAECERVCPVNIPIRMLNNKLEKEARDMFEYQPGMDPDQPSLISSFRDGDPNSFIR